MNKVAAAKILSAFLISALSVTAFASEKLDIQRDSDKQFTGSYQADEHLVEFDSSLQNDSVEFTIEIDGLARVAKFDLQGTQLELTAGEGAVSAKEQELMYDTAKTLVDYVNKQPSHALNDHLVVLVGAMNYWSNVNSVN